LDAASPSNFSGNFLAVAPARAFAISPMCPYASRSELYTLGWSPAFWASITALRVVACISIISVTASAGRLLLTWLRVVPTVPA
jgi:hypothetical protein